MLVFGKLCVRTKCKIRIALIQPQTNENPTKSIDLTWAAEVSLEKTFGLSCHAF